MAVLMLISCVVAVDKEYDPNVDYMELMIIAAIKGNQQDLEENEYVITLKKLNYEIVNIEKIYTADEISYIDAKTVWVLAKVKYIGD